MKRNMKNKKASMFAYYQMMFVFFRLFLLALALFSMAFFVYIFIDQTTNIQDKEMDLFVEQLIYSKNGISYTDPLTGRVYPGVISFADVANPLVVEEKLNKAFDWGKHPLMSANISFSFPEWIKDDDLSKIMPFYYNKERYMEWIYFAGKGRIIKVQSTTKSERSINIVIRKEVVIEGKVVEQLYPGVMKIILLSPNS